MSKKVNYFNKTTSGGDDALRVTCQSLEYSALASNAASIIRIIGISDTHGEHEVLGQLPQCDILIFCGNILNESKNMSDKEAREKLESFNTWLGTQPALHKLVIGGNHDQKLEDLQSRIFQAGIQSLFTNATYLCNTTVSIMGLTIAGLPFSVGNSSNKGFQSPEAAKQAEDFLNYLVEKDTKVDILITHGTCENIASVVKPSLAHFSGNCKANYGITRVMHAPLEIEFTSNRSTKKSAAKDLYCYNIVPTIFTVDYVPTNLPIVFDMERKSGPAANSTAVVGEGPACCVLM